MVRNAVLDTARTLNEEETAFLVEMAREKERVNDRIQRDEAALKRSRKQGQEIDDRIASFFRNLVHGMPLFEGIEEGEE
jgi:hypothetical protein